MGKFLELLSAQCLSNSKAKQNFKLAKLHDLLKTLNFTWQENEVKENLLSEIN